MPTGTPSTVGSILRNEFPILPFLTPSFAQCQAAAPPTAYRRTCTTTPILRSSSRRTHLTSLDPKPSSFTGTRRTYPSNVDASNLQTRSTYSSISTFFRDQTRRYSTQSSALLESEDGASVLDTEPNDGPHRSPIHSDSERRESNGNFFEAEAVKPAGTRPLWRRWKVPPSKHENINPDNARWLSKKRLQEMRERIRNSGSDATLRPFLASRRRFWRTSYIEALQTGKPFPHEDWKIPKSSLLWIKGLAILDAEYEVVPKSLNIPLDIRSGILGNETTFKFIIETGWDDWHQLCPEDRRVLFPRKLLCLMDHSVIDALKFLRTASRVDTLPLHVLEESLSYIFRSLKAPTEDRGGNLSAFMPLYLEILHYSPSWLSALMPPKWIWDLVNISNREQITILYDKIKYHMSSSHNLLHARFALNYALLGRIEDCMEALGRVLDGGVNIDSTLFHKICTIILNRCSSGDKSKGYAISSELASRLIQLGVRFNIRHYNVLMANAIEAGDLRTAFSIYDMLEQNRIQADAHTRAIIMKACKTADDRKSVDRLAQHCANVAISRREPIVAAEYTHYRYQTLQHEQNTFRSLLDVYSRFFDLSPLSRLGLISEATVEAIQTDEQAHLTEGMEPPASVLYLMVAARLQVTHTGTTDNRVLRLYNLFRKAVLEGDRLIAPLAETTHVYNIFLMAFCQRPGLLRHATAIIRDMSTSTSLHIQHPTEDRPLLQAQPDVKSWTILLKGFMVHQQPAAAERVLELMKERNIEPTEVTWETMLEGYARMQNVRGAVQAMINLEMKGLSLSERGLAALGRVRNRVKLMDEMRDVERLQGTTEQLVQRSASELSAEDDWKKPSRVRSSSAQAENPHFNRE